MRGTSTALLAGVALVAAPASAPGYGAWSTSYSPCSAGSIMADGTHVRFGSVASNWHPLGTRIYLTSTSFLGARRFTVRDRIGSGSQLDLWSPSCSFSFVWGRRYVTYRVGWPVLRGKVLKRRRTHLSQRVDH